MPTSFTDSMLRAAAEQIEMAFEETYCAYAVPDVNAPDRFQLLEVLSEHAAYEALHAAPRVQNTAPAPSLDADHE